MYQEALAKVTGTKLIRDKFENFIGGKWVARSKASISTIRAR